MMERLNGQQRISKECILKNSKGLHARPATLFVQTALSFRSEISVCNLRNEMTGDGKSVMSMLMLAAPCGTPIRITASGADSEQAVETLYRLLEQEFDDD